jgi:hypothetical protein
VWCFKNFKKHVHILILKKSRPSVLAKHQQLNNVLAAVQNLHSASRQQDANFIWLVASRMQTGNFVMHGR